MQALTLVRVHELDAVKEIMAQAAEIVAEWDGPEYLDKAAFSKAVDLLAARIPIVPQPPIPFDLDSLRGPRI